MTERDDLGLETGHHTETKEVRAKVDLGLNDEGCASLDRERGQWKWERLVPLGLEGDWKIRVVAVGELCDGGDHQGGDIKVDDGEGAQRWWSDVVEDDSREVVE